MTRLYLLVVMSLPTLSDIVPSVVVPRIPSFSLKERKLRSHCCELIWFRSQCK